MMHVPNVYRVRTGPFQSDASYGNNGIFIIPVSGRTTICCIASDQEGWEHVSVRIQNDNTQRTPTWAEMCKIKNMFWDEEDCVVQYHPPKSDYVDVHPFVLHLWRPIGVEMPRPPKELV